MIPVKADSEGDLFFITAKGTCKRTPSPSLPRTGVSGLRALNLREGDSLIQVRMVTSDDEEILMATEKGKAIRFKVSDVRPLGRTATGVKGIKLAKGDSVVAADTVGPDGRALLVSAYGYGKITCSPNSPCSGEAGLSSP